ncbi:MAG: hypothetical protein K2Y35_10560 [Burkholderiales bacterium]|nr:hypothetical protein [Burkholderiales bacterium]
MNAKLTLTLIGAVLAGTSLTATAGDRHGRGWDDRGFHARGFGHHHGQWHHRDWHPAPRGYHHRPPYRAYGGYPPPYAYDRDGVTIILRGRL